MSQTAPEVYVINKQTSVKNKTNAIAITIGTILVVLSPFVAPILAGLQEFACEKDSFGHCTLSSSLMMGIVSTFLPLILVALGLSLIIASMIQNRKK